MSDEQQAEIVADGYCPTCFALDDEACMTPGGRVVNDHAARHPSPPLPPRNPPELPGGDA